MRTSQCLKRVYFQDGFLAEIVTERSILQKVGMQLAKMWTWMQIKHKLSTSADTSSWRGCEMQWISRDEGSDRQYRSLVCSSVIGVEDARMTAIIERERESLGGIKIS